MRRSMERSCRRCGGGEEHGVTLVAGGESQGDGEMAFSESDAADEHDIGEVVEELQTEEVLDLGERVLIGVAPSLLPNQYLMN